MLNALFLIGQAELTSINTVANMTLYVGINPPTLASQANNDCQGNSSAFVVTVEGTEGYYYKRCTAESALAVLRLFVEGDSMPEVMALYELAGPLMPDTIDSPFRCIP